MQATDHETLLELLFDRIVEADLPEPVADLLLAAYEGDEALAALGHGEQPARPTALTESTVADEPPGMFVRAIHVEGLRGISRAATLDLQPGPGLTLVAGRNGRQVQVSPRGPDDDLDDGKWTVQPPGQKEQPFVDLRWRQPLEVYRPFLSYSELGGLIDGEPSKLHDALHDLLGLERLVTAEKRLIDLRKQLDAIVAAPRVTLRELKPDLPPATTRRRAGRVPAGRHAPGPRSPHQPGHWRLRAARRPRRPARSSRAGSASCRSRGRGRGAAGASPAAGGAAQHRPCRHRAPGCCPAGRRPGTSRRRGGRAVPGVQYRIPRRAWRQRAGAQLDELHTVARALANARREHEAAQSAIRSLGRPLPHVLTAPPAGIDTTATHQAWHRWLEATNRDSTDELLPAAQELGRRLGAVQAAAEAQLQQRDDAWKPLAMHLARWCEQARRAAETQQRAKDVKAAVSWFKDTRDELRNDRLIPFAAQSQWVWEELRQQSNVQLGSIRLSGTSNRRHLAVDVSVDGTGSSALAVMSQGELHSLGLALFLPRATTTESPFRFVIIDDPVQAMDPAKVDGLARVLANVAEHRQVVVFTHDDRLAEAVRRLQLSARVVEVVRGERSILELRTTDDPVRRHVDDARALASTPELPAQIRSELVAGYCRSAVEAACHATVRRRRLGRGERHEDVERTLERAHKLHQLVTLALFDDVDRGGDTLPHLNKRDRRAAAVLHAIKEGVHQGYRGEQHGLIGDAERLVAAVS